MSLADFPDEFVLVVEADEGLVAFGDHAEGLVGLVQFLGPLADLLFQFVVGLVEGRLGLLAVDGVPDRSGHQGGVALALDQVILGAAADGLHGHGLVGHTRQGDDRARQAPRRGAIPPWPGPRNRGASGPAGRRRSRRRQTRALASARVAACSTGVPPRVRPVEGGLQEQGVGGVVLDEQNPGWPAGLVHGGMPGSVTIGQPETLDGS